MRMLMPRLDGLPAVRRIKAELPHTRIVILTLQPRTRICSKRSTAAVRVYFEGPERRRSAGVARRGGASEVALSPGLAGRILQELAKEANTLSRLIRETKSCGSSRRASSTTLQVQRGCHEIGSHRTHRQVSNGQIVNRLQLRNRSQVLE